MNREQLSSVYEKLHDRYGWQNWWPIVVRERSVYLDEFRARPRTSSELLEIAVGAVLTQNTAWKNVEKAVANLKREKLLSLPALRSVDTGRLAEIITPAGYFNQKAKKLKALVGFIDAKMKKSLSGLSQYPPDEARSLLLDIWGVGRETADSILNYGLGMPVFVVDAYTRRIFSRLGWIDAAADYDELRAAFEKALPREAVHYQEFHALIVRHGVELCANKPRCGDCPLKRSCGHEPPAKD